MSGFTGPLDIRFPDFSQVGTFSAELLTDLDYVYDRDGIEVTITMKAGSKTNLATTPRFLWPLIPPFGPYGRAAAIHDELYFTTVYSREESDLIFRKAMRDCNVSRFWRYLLWLGVRIGGGRIYRKFERLNNEQSKN